MGDMGKGKCYRCSTIFDSCCYRSGGVFFAVGNKFYIRYLVSATGLIICKDDSDFVIVVVEPLTVRLCVVASPDPKRIVEINAIRALTDAGFVPVCVGGGGIPVTEAADGTLSGTAAVIDKDLAAEKLAEDVNADTLLILTAVERISIRYGKPDQQDMARMTVAQAEQYIKEGHFAPGSMLPKVQAALRFVKSGPGRRAIVTSLEKAAEALHGRAGTELTA